MAKDPVVLEGNAVDTLKRVRPPLVIASSGGPCGLVRGGACDGVIGSDAMPCHPTGGN
jgi:hypothetical protein